MEFLSYEVVEGTEREADIVEATKSALNKIFSLTASDASLTSEEKCQVRVLTGKQKDSSRYSCSFPAETPTVQAKLWVKCGTRSSSVPRRFTSY